MMSRSILRALHGYIGITFGLLILFQALTGTFLAFYWEMDHWLADDLYETSGEPRFTPFELKDVVEARYAKSQVSDIGLWTHLDKALVFHVQELSGDQQVSAREVFVDPATGRINGDRVSGEFCWRSECVVPFVFELHENLAVGTVGRWLLGVSAFGWLATSIVGALLTLPPTRSQRLQRWKQAWRFPANVNRGPARRVVFGVHRASGLWTWLLAAIIALTGFALAFYDEVAVPAVNVISAPTVGELNKRPASPRHELKVRPEQALAIAHTAAKEYARARTIELGPPVSMQLQPAYGGFVVSFKTGKAVMDLPYFGGLAVSVDGDDGSVLDIRPETGKTTGDLILRLLYPIHSGQILRLPGQVLVALTGLGFLVIGIAGFWLWLNRRRMKKT